MPGSYTRENAFVLGLALPSMTTDPQKVSLEEVRRVAELAHLELSPDEETAMRRDLNAILAHVAQLSELDTSAVSPMAQVSEILPANQTAANANTLRADVSAPSLDRGNVMRSAPETDGVFFRVPKVIER